MKKIVSFFLCLVVAKSVCTAQSKMNFELLQKKASATTEQIDVFIKGDITEISQICQQVNGRFKHSCGNIAAVKIPATSLALFAASPKIQRIEAYPTHYQPMNDTMLRNNNIYPVHSGMSPLTQGYDGTGVVMGIIDTGIDFSHPDFRDSLGNTRIKALWDQRLPVAPNTPSYGYGQEWNSAGIDGGLAAASTDIDWYGHGTHVAGIAVGNGLASGTYKGAAPKAEIVMVVYDFYSSNPTLMTDAVDYIYKKADTLGKPCVINASLGSYYGSHDGLNLEAQLIKNMIDAKPGRALVAAAGNAGAFPYHLGYTVTSDTNFTFFPNVSGSVNLSLYADVADMLNVSVSIGADQMAPTHSFRGRTPFVTGAAHLGVIMNDTIYNGGNRIGIIQSYGDTASGVYTLMYNIIPDSTSYNWRLIATGSGRFDVWNFDVVGSGIPSPATLPDSIYYKYPDVDQTIVSSFQCLDNVITVANYINRKSVLNYNSIMYVDPFKTPGLRHPSSSSGPTRDGRIKPDIAAPGEFIMSCTLLSTLPGDAILYPDAFDPGGYHVSGNGTSAASPGVAGIAALYLQKNPTATAMDVKNAIISCTTIDAFTGAVPNNQYGYGKANAFNALTGCVVTSIESDHSTANFSVYPNPSASGTVTINLHGLSIDESHELEIYNSLGQLISSQKVKNGAIESKHFCKGIYFCRLVSNSRIVATQKMIIL